MSELAILLFMAVALLLWLESRRAQEIAVAYCRRVCRAAGVQFLDDIAPVWRVRFARDATGVLRLRRIYTFDYSTADGERRRGSLVMLGRTPVSLQLEERAATGAVHTDHFVP